MLRSHFGNVGWADRGAARALGVPHVVTFYGLDVNQLPATDPQWRGRYRTLFGQVSRVLCEGPHMAEAVMALGCPGEKVRVHHLGVRLETIPFAPLAWTPGEPLRILIAASFREKKGIPDALEAIAQVRAAVPVKVTVLGDAGADAPSQAEKRRILEVADRHGLADVITWAGYQPHAAFLAERERTTFFCRRVSPRATAIPRAGRRSV